MMTASTPAPMYIRSLLSVRASQVKCPLAAERNLRLSPIALPP
jgi:hypothetical protein